MSQGRSSAGTDEVIAVLSHATNWPAHDRNIFVADRDHRDWSALMRATKARLMIRTTHPMAPGFAFSVTSSGVAFLKKWGPTNSGGCSVKYHVKYYDRKLSKKGRGTQIRVFEDRAKAEGFAARNQIYARPCKVEVVEDDGQ